jgi:hypothetical protein
VKVPSTSSVSSMSLLKRAWTSTPITCSKSICLVS